MAFTSLVKNYSPSYIVSLPVNPWGITIIGDEMFVGEYGSAITNVRVFDVNTKNLKRILTVPTFNYSMGTDGTNLLLKNISSQIMTVDKNTGNLISTKTNVTFAMSSSASFKVDLANDKIYFTDYSSTLYIKRYSDGVTLKSYGGFSSCSGVEIVNNRIYVIGYSNKVYYSTELTDGEMNLSFGLSSITPSTAVCGCAKYGDKLFVTTYNALSIGSFDIYSTLGQQRSDVKEMQIGDYIPIRYTALSANALGTFSEFGTSTAVNIPYTPATTADGLLYFIFVGYDSRGRMKLIADRLLNKVSPDVLNTAGIDSWEGADYDLGLGSNFKTSIRLMTGGIGDTDNEWDRIIVSSSLSGTMVSGDENVWRWSYGYNTVFTGYSSSGYRVLRGSSVSGYSGTTSNSALYGFRPVLIIEFMDQYPTLSLNVPSTGQYPRSTAIALTGTATDPDNDLLSYKITNLTTNTILNQGSGLSVPYNLSYNIDVTQLPLGVNIIKVEFEDPYHITDYKIFKVYVLPDKYYIYTKSCMTKNVPISRSFNNVMVSIQSSGTLVLIYSIDGGSTWILGNFDESIDISPTNQIKVRFLMLSSGSSLKAYGIGWV